MKWLNKLLDKMSLKRSRSASAQEATDSGTTPPCSVRSLKLMQSDHFNAQVRAADERAAATIDSPAPSPFAGSVRASSAFSSPAPSPFASNMKAPSALASSPSSTPIKIPARKERRIDSPPPPESPDELQESSPTSTTALLGTSPERSTKRPRLGFASFEDTQPDSSPTPVGPRISTDSVSTRMTLIGACQLAKLREDKDKLLEANKGLAKESAKLKKKATKDAKISDENDVLIMENNRLERAIEKENQENVELEFQVRQLRQERDQLKETCDQLQHDHERLRGAFFSLNNRILSGEVAVAAPASPEPNSSPGIDLARGFERYGRSGEEGVRK